MARLATMVSACFALIALTPGTALAHGDVRLADETIVVQPGEQRRFAGSLHYHRVVARLTADGAIRARLLGADGRAVLTAGPAETITFNNLVACCDDTWALYALVIGNPGIEPVTVTVDAGFIHDDLAVAVYRAESGIPLSIAVLGGLWALALARARKAQAGRSLARAVVPFAALVLVVLALAFLGAARYGGGGPPALVAVMLDVPVLPFNRGVSRATLVLLAAMVLWGWTGTRWVRARPEGAGIAWFVHGTVLLGSVAITAALMINAYDDALIPAAWAVAAAAPVVWVMASSAPSHD